MSTTTHIMVDLETWGTAPGCDIRSIGAVVFDPIAGALGDEFYVNVTNPAGRMLNGVFETSLARGNEDYRKYPLTRDPATVAWWSDQSIEAQARLTTDVFDLAHGLARFADWWSSYDTDAATFWANGPHFDEAILAACYRATGQDVPWSYRAPRDCRTIWEAAGWPEVPFDGVQHDALADAKYQAQRVIAAYRALGLGAGA